MTIGASQWHKTSTGCVAIYSLPSIIDSIILLPPAKPDRPIEKYLKLVKMSDPGSSIKIG
jgi:hypothetical protein